MIRGKVTTRVKDRGFNFMRKKLGRLDGQGFDVGYWGEDKYPPRPGDKPDAKVLTTVDTAAMAEFGTDTSPRRPFQRETFRRSFVNLNQAIRVLYNRMLADPAYSEDMLLRKLGRNYRIEMQKTIADAKSWAAPNAPATVKKKGHNSPLLERYRMIARIKMRIGRRIDR
jgi:hypothetical protein